MLIIFFEKYTPLPRGYGGIFSEQQTTKKIMLNIILNLGRNALF